MTFSKISKIHNLPQNAKKIKELKNTDNAVSNGEYSKQTMV